MTRASDISPLSLLLGQIDAVADGATPRDTLPTGFESLDRVLGGGLRSGDLVVLGGDVGSGKSALALAIAVRSAHQGRRVCLLTSEMTAERVLERALAIEGRVRVDDMRQGALNDISRASVGAAAIRLRDAMLRIDRLPDDGVDALPERLDWRWGPELVVVDSLQALCRGGRTQDEELAHAVRRLKALALDGDVTILSTAQLPLLVPRSDRRPQLDDFGALGAVKQHADVVLALYRESMYDISRDVEGATELLVRKNRNGSTGYVDLYFYSQWMRFEDMLDPDR